MRPGIILLREGTDTSQVRYCRRLYVPLPYGILILNSSPSSLFSTLVFGSFFRCVWQGKAQLISNINACEGVVDAVRTTLGPRGMDKLVADGRKVTISNDGATIMRLLEIEHPAAKTLVDISMSQVRFIYLQQRL